MNDMEYGINTGTADATSFRKALCTGLIRYESITPAAGGGTKGNV